MKRMKNRQSLQLMKTMKANKFLLLLLITGISFAQHTATATIEKVTESGFHKIALSPEIRSFSKEDLGDLRIYDSNNKEVPYAIFNSVSHNLLNNFENYRIVSKSSVPKKKTSIVIEVAKENYTEVALVIGNSEITKFYSVSGSDDLKNWYGLVNKEQLGDYKTSVSSKVIRSIQFPKTSYRYIKIDLDDTKTLPINILEAGRHFEKLVYLKTKKNSLNDIRIKKTEDVKKTIYQINSNQPQIIDQLLFAIKSPTYYKRSVTIYKNEILKRKRKTTTYRTDLAHFELNSENKDTLSVPQFFEKEWFIEIDNQDNPPLEIKKLNFLQNILVIVADLKSNETYTVKTGNPQRNTPSYDLSYFSNKIESDIPEAKLDDVKHEISKNIVSKKTSIWQQSWFMWLCISLAGIAVAYFSLSLAKDIQKK